MARQPDRRAVLAGALVLVAGMAKGATAMETGLQPAAERIWTYVADTVMGGVSQGRSEVADGIVRLSGEVSTANRGGFIQVRTTLDTQPDPQVDGIALRVRGNGERYFLHLRTRGTRLPWQYYQAGFETGADWQDIRIPLTAFEPSGGLLARRVDPTSIRSIGLVAYGRDHTADVSLAAIGFY